MGVAIDCIRNVYAAQRHEIGVAICTFVVRRAAGYQCSSKPTRSTAFKIITPNQQIFEQQSFPAKRSMQVLLVRQQQISLSSSKLV